MMSDLFEDNRHNNEIIEYPCDFPLKVFGHNDADFEQLVLDLLKPHFADDVEFVVSRNQSRHGKYQSLTIRFTAHSRQQLDAIYQSLSDCDQVVMSL